MYATSSSNGFASASHILVEARPSAHNQTRIEDTPRVITHAAHPTYPASEIEKLAIFV
jgi:hypothetical protein